MAENLIFAEVLLPQGEDLMTKKVLQQAIDDNGKLIGSHNEKILMNTLAYNIELQDQEVFSQ